MLANMDELSLAKTRNRMMVAAKIADAMNDSGMNRKQLARVITGAVAQLLQLASRFPGIRPPSVLRQIAYRVICVCGIVKDRQFILPVCISVCEGDRAYHSTDCSRGVIIYLLGQDIPATVIPVYPGSARLVYPARFERRIVYGIVHPHQLSQGVVLVSGNVPVPGLARYVAPVIIRVRQVERVCSAPLGDGLYKGSRRIGAVRSRALYVPVLRIIFVAVCYLPAGYAMTNSIANEHLE